MNSTVFPNINENIVPNGHILGKSEKASLQNEAGKHWVVQKYGGTAVGKFPHQIASIVKRSLPQTQVAVVCSARSTSIKSEGTTTRLLLAASKAEAPDSRGYEAIIESVRRDHVEAASIHVKSSKLQAELIARIDEVCRKLNVTLAAVKELQVLHFQTRDKIVSNGEVLSCLFMTAVLQDSGVDAEFVDLSEVVTMRDETDPLLRIKAPEGVGQSFYDQIALDIEAKLNTYRPRIPVVTGYFGTVPGGLLSAIGRGYTDLCAALAAVAVSASELQIWKEVDGIFSADPRIVPTAYLLPFITPAEASELTFYGSEVVHPFTMDQVMRKRIPIAIKNVKNPNGSGTKILPDPLLPQVDGVNGEAQSKRGSFYFRPRSNHVPTAQVVRPKRPTAVTIKRNILVINVHSNKRSLASGFLERIFSTPNKHRLSVDMISTSQVNVSMALHSEEAFVRTGGAGKRIVDKDLEGALEELNVIGEIDLVDDMAIVSLIGKDMKNMKGISGRMFSVLGEANINIEMISQGASEINISCVIEGRDADRAMSILHTNLFTFLDGLN